MRGQILYNAIPLTGQNCHTYGTASAHIRHFVAIALCDVRMQPTEPRCLLQLRLLFERETVDDAPAVAIVALDPKNGLREFWSFGWGG